MTEERKQLYRDLLGWAMVDMQLHSAAATNILRSLFSRRRSHREVIRFTYAMNQWLHNTALYSATGFEGFEEDLFWEGYRRFRHLFSANKWAPHLELVIKKLQ